MCRNTGYSSVMPLPAEDGTGEAGVGEGVADVVHLSEADLLGGERALVLAAAEMQRNQHRPVGRHHDLDQLLLGELEPGDRLVELLDGRAA
jgi:hypothetical protein